MSFHKITVFLLLAGLAFYPYSSARGEDKNMMKLVFVLKITDETKYRAYRNKIKPLMQQLNIVVLKEYRISTVVHSKEEKEAVNLLAIFGFPNRESKTLFFSNPVYEEAKQLFAESTTHFEKLME